ncbi:cytochrome P460 family protein [Vibrio metoecus]|uniref:cytochrome P460 family protein n=1 Tax=Vibrio metoecus TaxID=1481663 RepID=UPI0001B99375|nr:cytochrome P460 family protein [Vibrio metoecus]EEX66171.1 hypothetical protein VCJ_001316 [Vibrio metoecus]MCR9388747.1 cytochrome P460 family protein [Vibrio metoecus]
MPTHTLKSLLTICFASSLSIGALAEDLPSEFVDKEGNITLPSDFRTSTTHLGSWFVPAGEASGFHGVYANQGTIEYFRKHGKFPDGAVIIKELRASNSGNYTTGSGVSHETGNLKQWFVMVKDSKERFSNNPVWGDGWGWALFKTENPTKNVATNYKTDCMGCHLPAKDKDWIYTEGYPVLGQ